MATPVRLREAIIRAFHDRGLSYEAIADLLAVGRATVSRVLRRHRETGSVQPRPRGGGNFSPIRDDAEQQLRILIATQPDLTVAEMAAELGRATGIRTSRSSVQRALVRLGYTRKKRASSPASATRPRTKSAARPSRR